MAQRRGVASEVTSARWGRGMAQSGSASALGAEGRRFKSCCPDHSTNRLATAMVLFGSSREPYIARKRLNFGWFPGRVGAREKAGAAIAARWAPKI